MSELEIEIKNLIEALAEWKGSDVRYGEVFKKKTLTSIMQLIKEERIKAQKEIIERIHQDFITLEKIATRLKQSSKEFSLFTQTLKYFDELKQSLEGEHDEHS